MMPRTPHVHNDRIKKPRGTCSECGKSVMLRGNDGLIRSHVRRSSGVECEGSGKAPSKLVVDVKVDWVPPRRSN
jgi:hypothetical protein